MKKEKLFWLVPALCLASCNGEKAVLDTLAQAPRVGYQNQTIVCELDKMTETLSVPLSLLTEAPHIVKLDNRDEATVDPQGHVTVTDHYILIRKHEKPIPTKLFTRKGEYVAQVGELGDGPGQHKLVYDQQLDEQTERIYLCPWMTDHLLEYDLKGRFVRNIPLARKYQNVKFPKTRFRIDGKRQRITACTLPFNGLPVLAWTQDMEGNIIDEVPIPKNMKMRPDFSHEVLTPHATDGLDVFITSSGPCVYNYANGQLKPVAQTQATTPPAFQVLSTFPHHILGCMAPIVQTGENSWAPGEIKDFILDRETQQGGLYTLTNDYWGGVEVANFSGRCNSGYYTYIYTPQEMRNVLTQVLSHPDALSASLRKSMQQTLDGIRDNDTGYLVYARLR